MYASQHEPNRAPSINPAAAVPTSAVSPLPPANLARTGDAAAAVSQGDRAALFDHISGGVEPNLIPLLQRPASRAKKMAEYHRMIDRRCTEEPPENVVEWALMNIAKVLARFNAGAMFHFSRNSDGEREWALLESGNEDAFQLAVRKPLGLVKQGNLKAALACYGQALEAAPHRARDTYETLAKLCMTLLRWQRDVKMGEDSLDLEVEPYLEFQALGSPLYGNNVEPTTHPREGFYASASYSQIDDPFADKRQPVDLPALRRALEETRIPLAAIARAAIEQADEIRKQEGRSHHICIMNGAQYREGLMMYLAGRFEEAARALRESLDKFSADRHMENSIADIEPLAWALRDSGATKEAVDVFGRALSYPYIDEHHYWDLLRLCEEQVMRSASGENRWALALPHLKERYDELVRVHGEGLGDDWMSSYYLGRACQEAGRKEESRTYLEITAGILETKIHLYRQYGYRGHREDAYLRRMEEVLSAVVSLSEVNDTPGFPGSGVVKPKCHSEGGYPS